MDTTDTFARDKAQHEKLNRKAALEYARAAHPGLSRREVALIRGFGREA